MYQLPRQCRLYCAINPALQWGWQEILQNKTTFLLEMLVWQRTKDGQKRAPIYRPKLFIPDFMRQDSTISHDSEVHTVDDIKDLLARPRH